MSMDHTQQKLWEAVNMLIGTVSLQTRLGHVFGPVGVPVARLAGVTVQAQKRQRTAIGESQ
jgi:hypothetical protein